MTILKNFLPGLLAASLFLSACTGPNTNETSPVTQGSPINIVTSFGPLYSLVSNLIDDKVQVTNLVPPGASVHTWEPSSSSLVALSEADLLVMNGLELEPFMEDLIEAAQNPDLKVVVTADAATDMLLERTAMIELGEEEEEEEGHHHHHEGQDPHIWLDPQVAIKQMEAIRDALMEVDPENQTAYENRAALYAEKLNELDETIAEQLAAATPKDFIVFHDAYVYYLNRYGLLANRQAAIEPFPGKEPTAAYFQGLLELIEAKGVDIVFTEPQFNPVTVQNLQEEADIRSFEISPIGLELSADAYENNLKNLTDTFLEAFE